MSSKVIGLQLFYRFALKIVLLKTSLMRIEPEDPMKTNRLAKSKAACQNGREEPGRKAVTWSCKWCCLINTEGGRAGLEKKIPRELYHKGQQ